MRRSLIIIALVLVAALTATTLATGGGKGLIRDDGHYAKPGSLDDGKELLPQTKISLAAAVAAAQRAQSGNLGQVDLEHFEGRIVYMVDVGNQEVRVDAANGSIVAVGPQE